jgi:hypothetical protein
MKKTDLICTVAFVILSVLGVLFGVFSALLG